MVRRHGSHVATPAGPPGTASARRPWPKSWRRHVSGPSRPASRAPESVDGVALPSGEPRALGATPFQVPDLGGRGHRLRPADAAGDHEDPGGVAADQPGRLRARTTDGRQLVAEVPRSGGGPDDSGIDRLVRDKAVANLGSADRVEEILGLPDAPSLEPLLTALEDA